MSRHVSGQGPPATGTQADFGFIIILTLYGQTDKVRNSLLKLIGLGAFSQEAQYQVWRLLSSSETICLTTRHRLHRSLANPSGCL